MKLVITFWMPCARAFCSDELRERRKKSQAERKEEAAKGEDHEPGSIAEDSQRDQRTRELEQQGKHVVDNPLGSTGSRASLKRNATTMTSEQLRSLAARVYPAAAAAKKRKTAKASPQASKITKHFQREKGP